MTLKKNQFDRIKRVSIYFYLLNFQAVKHAVTAWAILKYGSGYLYRLFVNFDSRRIHRHQRALHNWVNNGYENVLHQYISHNSRFTRAQSIDSQKVSVGVQTHCSVQQWRCLQRKKSCTIMNFKNTRLLVLLLGDKGEIYLQKSYDQLQSGV